MLLINQSTERTSSVSPVSQTTSYPPISKLHNIVYDIPSLIKTISIIVILLVLSLLIYLSKVVSQYEFDSNIIIEKLEGKKLTLSMLENKKFNTIFLSIFGLFSISLLVLRIFDFKILDQTSTAPMNKTALFSIGIGFAVFLLIIMALTIWQIVHLNDNLTIKALKESYKVHEFYLILNIIFSLVGTLLIIKTLKNYLIDNFLE